MWPSKPQLNSQPPESIHGRQSIPNVYPKDLILASVFWLEVEGVIEFPVQVDSGNAGDMSRWKAFRHDRDASRSMREVEKSLPIKNIYAFKVADEMVSRGA